MSHQMDSENCYHGKYSSRGLQRKLFNGMMNKFKWFVTIIGDVYALFRKTLVTLILVQQSNFPDIAKTATTKTDMVLQDALSAIDAAKQVYKIILSENNFNRFYDKTVTTAEEHNIEQPELPSYFR